MTGCCIYQASFWLSQLTGRLICRNHCLKEIKSCLKKFIPEKGYYSAGLNYYLNGKRWDGGKANASKLIYCPSDNGSPIDIWGCKNTSYRYSQRLGWAGCPASISKYYGPKKINRCPSPSNMVSVLEGQPNIYTDFYDIANASDPNLAYRHGNKLKNNNLFIAGHAYGKRPDVEKHCYQPMDELLSRKNKIEQKFAQKHFQNGCIVLYDITNTWFEGEYKNSENVCYGRAKGGKHGYKQIALGLLTNNAGCPVAVEIFKGSTSDQTTVLDQVKKISKTYGIKEAIFTGDRGMLTQKRIDEIRETDFKIITALTHIELKNLIKKENIQMDLFDQMNITEVLDSKDNKTRYMLCKNDNKMQKERDTRSKLIAKVEELLSIKAAVKRKRQIQKVSASVGRIFAKYKIEKFFSWKVGKNGELAWSLKHDIIEKEEELDGCYVIKTDSSTELMSKQETVDSYRNLQKVEQAFKNIKTVMLELRPVYHKSDDRIKAHIFIVMLAYYLQWHAMQKLKPLFDEDGKGKDKRWTFEGIIDRLKSIRKVENLINGTVIKTNISTLDEEQQQILKLLEVKLM